MAGAVTMGNLAHGTETVLTHVEDRRLAPNEALFDLLDEIHDTFVTMLDALTHRKTAPDVRDLVARVAALLATGALPSGMAAPAVSTTPGTDDSRDGGGRTASGTAVEEVGQRREQLPKKKAPPKPASGDGRDAGGTTPGTEEVEPRREQRPRATPGTVAGTAVEEPLRTSDAADEVDGEARQAWPESMERRGQVRVSTGLLSNLVNYAGEVSIARARMEQQVYSFRDNLTELARNITRFRDQIRELEIQSESQILYRLEQQGEAVADQDTDFDPGIRPLHQAATALAPARREPARLDHDSGRPRQLHRRGSDRAAATGAHQHRVAGRPDAHAPGRLQYARRPPAPHRTHHRARARQAHRTPSRRRRGGSRSQHARAHGRAVRAYDS